jgi:hypothetical protein
MLAASAEDLNEKLVHIDQRNDPVRTYHDLPLDIEEGKELVYVTTQRTSSDLLYRHFVFIQDSLEKLHEQGKKQNKTIRAEYADVRLFEIRQLIGKSGHGETAEEIEMPHKQHHPYLKKWLHISS